MQINPQWQEAFKGELIENLRRVSNDFTRQLFLKDLWEGCIMYSCDMCLHYYKAGPVNGITLSTIDNIAYNVCVALGSVVREFDESQYQVVYDGVRELMSAPNTYNALQQQIDNYYRR